jgi:hypothetical protein
MNLPAKVVTHGPLHQFQLAQVAVITDDVRKILILITRQPRGLRDTALQYDRKWRQSCRDRDYEEGPICIRVSFRSTAKVAAVSDLSVSRFPPRG